MTTRLQKNVKQYLKDSIGITGVLFILYIFLSMFLRTSGSLLTQKDILNVLGQISSDLFLACGMTMVIILGGIDLSVGSIIAPSGCSAAGYMSRYSLLIAVGVLGGVLVGIVVGVLDGTVISETTMPSFIVTLATMSMAKGLAYVYTGGSPVCVITKEWQFLGTEYVDGVLAPIILLAVMLVITAIIISKIRLRCHIYAVGGNSQTVRLSDVNAAKVKFLVHTCSEVMAGLADVILASHMCSGQPTAGDGAEMDAIAAVVVGGTSMVGGSNKIGGAIAGDLVTGMPNNKLNLLNVNSFWQHVVRRTVILLAVFVDYLRNKKTEQSLVYGKSVSRQWDVSCQS